ncbi:hypothetical protein AMC82_PD00826 (plasmid) [Rhizobium phaseoli]|nr:hypothetical protein AMC84_PD00829 [Rhizobium phaseoli]ANL76224.1 hypothetical protein AMC83_PE00815 [Rhizobium phaseoli]ANL82581.1 hypothetical protein AMC82_PD00826 [Rhizobium phaseoli]
MPQQRHAHGQPVLGGGGSPPAYGLSCRRLSVLTGRLPLPPDLENGTDRNPVPKASGFLAYDRPARRLYCKIA